MTPAARVQTAIELLDQIIVAATSNGPPADRIIAQGMRERRYAGSKDRRAIRELVFGAIRACGPVPKNGRAAILKLTENDASTESLFDGSNYGPAALGANETAATGGVAPDWLTERLANSGVTDVEAEALLGRAPLDIRINTLKADRSTIELPEQGEPLAAPNGVRMPTGTNVDQWPAFREGQIEVQDHGSQLACLAADAQPGETVIDLCAGAGGKTLALAAAMDNQGTLIGSDTNRARLSELSKRAERAGASIAETILLNPGQEREALARWHGKADCVLVDAPCSGTGTWRRQPDNRWRLTDNQLAKYVETQAYLLDLASDLVQPNGRIIFVTCSLLDAEGAEQAEAFLARNDTVKSAAISLPAGEPRGKGIRLSPYHNETDGFFIARFDKL